MIEPVNDVRIYPFYFEQMNLSTIVELIRSIWNKLFLLFSIRCWARRR